jgi:hypothetical protein
MEDPTGNWNQITRGKAVIARGTPRTPENDRLFREKACGKNAKETAHEGSSKN